MKRIINWSNYFVNIFLFILVLISVSGAIPQILPNYLKLSSTNLYIINGLTLLIVVMILARKTFSKYIQISLRFITAHSRIFLLVLGIFIVTWQIWFVSSIVGATSWDPTGTIMRAIGPSKLDFSAHAYISTYPNNFLLFLFEKGVWILFNKPSIEKLTLILALFNIILVDISLLLSGKVIKRFFNTFTNGIYQFLSLSLLVLSPWISVPYSDIWGYFLSSVTIFLVISLFYVEKKWQKITFSLLTGLTFSTSYFMKPSLIIFYIAVAIVLVVTLISKKKQFDILSISTILLSALILTVSFSAYRKNNSIINIDDKQTFSMMHFAAMGTTQRGGYNAADVKKDRAIKDPDKREQRDIKVYKKRLKSFNKFANYQRFIIQKQPYNTADGTFTWGNSGNLDLYYPKDNFPQRLFSTKRIVQKNRLYTLFVQIVWTLSLIFILFTMGNKRLFVQIIKYTVVGFFLFLLIFEGGRSRYLIQFLPFLILLSSIGANKLFSDLNSLRKLKKY